MLECSFPTAIPEAVVVLTAIPFLVPRRMSDKTLRFRSAAPASYIMQHGWRAETGRASYTRCNPLGWYRSISSLQRLCVSGEIKTVALHLDLAVRHCEDAAARQIDFLAAAHDGAIQSLHDQLSSQ